MISEARLKEIRDKLTKLQSFTKLQGWEAASRDLLAARDQLKERVEALEETLRFYARKECYGPIDYSESIIEQDCGKKARAALARTTANTGDGE